MKLQDTKDTKDTFDASFSFTTICSSVSVFLAYILGKYGNGKALITLKKNISKISKLNDACVNTILE